MEINQTNSNSGDVNNAVSKDGDVKQSVPGYYKAGEDIEVGDFVAYDNAGIVYPVCRHGMRRSKCPECKRPQKRRYAYSPRRPTGLRRIWRWFLARYRLNDLAVCEMSVGRGQANDFHDYPDDIHGVPMHFCTLTCKRCGKKFVM